MLRGGRRARDLHSEDAVARAASRLVAFATIAVASAATVTASCAKSGPAPSAALEGRRDGGRGARRDASAGREEEEEEEREDIAAYDAGISVHALSCTADRDCMTHRCDTAVQRCRFPCRSDDDCNPGARCDVDAGSLAACFKR